MKKNAREDDTIRLYTFFYIESSYIKKQLFVQLDLGG